MDSNSAIDKASLYHDLGSLNQVRSMGKNGNKKEALQAVAKQFEAYFLNELMKNSRKTNELINEDSLFNGDKVSFFQQMHDEQMASTMAKTSGFGIAEMVVRQLSPDNNRPKSEFSLDGAESGIGTSIPNKQGLMIDMSQYQHQSRNMKLSDIDKDTLAAFADYRANRTQAAYSDPNTTTNTDESIPEGDKLDANIELKPIANPNQQSPAESEVSRDDSQNIGIKSPNIETKPISFESPQAFIESLIPYARKAAKMIGTSPRVLIAQAALETGWGKFVIQDKSGQSSFNLFNIKSDQRWSGAEVAKPTLEYEHGVAVKKVETFRAYESFEQSFMDYANFVKNSERYQGAVEQGSDEESYIEKLHQAGYATDPHYSDKVKSIMKSDAIQYLPE